jgi:hypothetical protein
MTIAGKRPIHGKLPPILIAIVWFSLPSLAPDQPGKEAVGFDGDDLRRAPPQAPPAENTAEKQRVRQQMLARNWHDDAISSELGSFCQKSHLEC